MVMLNWGNILVPEVKDTTVNKEKQEDQSENHREQWCTNKRESSFKVLTAFKEQHLLM